MTEWNVPVASSHQKNQNNKSKMTEWTGERNLGSYHIDVIKAFPELLGFAAASILSDNSNTLSNCLKVLSGLKCLRWITKRWLPITTVTTILIKIWQTWQHCLCSRLACSPILLLPASTSGCPPQSDCPGRWSIYHHLWLSSWSWPCSSWSYHSR